MKSSLIFDLGRSGGCPHYASKIAENISTKECRVRYFISSNRINRSASINATSLPMYKTFSGFVFSSFTVLPLLLLSLFFLRLRYSTVYFPYFHYWSVPIAFVSRFLGFKVVSTIHDGVPHLGDGKFAERVLIKCYAFLSNSLVFLTSAVKDQMLVSYQRLSRKEVSVIPHGLIAVEGFCGRDRNFHRVGADVGAFKVLFFGRVLKYKGVELLSEASDFLENMGFPVEFFIAGKWGYPMPSEIKCSKNISVMDRYICESEIGDIFSSSDVLIMPYIEATQSGVASLAIFTETPIIYTDVGGLKEQVQACGYQISPDAISIANSIALLYSDKDLYQSIQHEMRITKAMLKWENIAGNVYENFN